MIPLRARVLLTTVRATGTVVGRITKGTLTAYRVTLDSGEGVIATDDTLLRSIVRRPPEAPSDVEYSA